MVGKNTIKYSVEKILSLCQLLCLTAVDNTIGFIYDLWIYLLEIPYFVNVILFIKLIYWFCVSACAT